MRSNARCTGALPPPSVFMSAIHHRTVPHPTYAGVGYGRLNVIDLSRGNYLTNLVG